jgi:Tfp pilus assembly protein PilN
MTQNTSMNFLPEDYVEKRQAARAAVVFIGLLLVVVGGIVGAFLFTQHQMKGVFEKRDQVNRAFEDASKKIEEAKELEKQKARMVAKAEITATLMERVRRSSLLAELVKLRPQNVNFIGLELKSKEIQAAQAPARPNSDLEKARRQQEGLPGEATKPAVVEVHMDLFGTAPTDQEVATYMTALQKSALLKDVNLLFSEEYKRPGNGTEEKKEMVRRFHVEMKVNPDADLRGMGTITDASAGKGSVEK